MRVPGIFWWPEHIVPAVQMDMGSTMDLLPTFCRLAGVEIPKDRIIDGVDLSETLLDDSISSPRETMFFWRASQLYAVREGPWKAHFITRGAYGIGPEKEVHETPELYNVDTDPSEKYNVSSLHPDVVARLTKLADAHRKSIVPVKDQLVERIEPSKN
jgi:arylsulfatase A-like enzyme